MHVEWITTNEADEEVENFIARSANGGLFHSPGFLCYHESSKFPYPEFEICHLVVRDETGIIAFMPGMRVSSQGRRIYRSPLGSSYGGLVHKLGLFYEDLDSIFEAVITEMDRQFDEIRITPPSPVYVAPDASMANYQHFLLLKHGFQVSSADLLLCATLTGRKDLMTTFHRKTRTELNQALRNNLELELSDFVTPEDYQLLFLSQSHFSATPTHSMDELATITHLRPNDVKVFRTIHQGQIIGGIICFKISNRVLNTSAGYNDKKNLIFFKEKFGAHPYLRYAYIRSSIYE
jgi:hypothetical protein